MVCGVPPATLPRRLALGFGLMEHLAIPLSNLKTIAKWLVISTNLRSCASLRAGSVNCHPERREVSCFSSYAKKTPKISDGTIIYPAPIKYHVRPKEAQIKSNCWIARCFSPPLKWGKQAIRTADARTRGIAIRLLRDRINLRFPNFALQYIMRFSRGYAR